MVGCSSIARWLVALGVAVACGCSGVVQVPPLVGGKPAVAAYRPDLPDVAQPLRIAEAPKVHRPPIATLGPLESSSEPEDAILATTPLVARAPAPADPAPTEPAGDLRTLYRLAADHYAKVSCYVVRMHRREQVNGKNRPEEVLLFKFRKEPWSVYFKWLSEEGKNREVIYVKGQHGNLIHTLTAAGDLPLLPFAGKHIKLAPDSFLVKAASPHPITEAGVGNLIEQFGAILDAAEHSVPPADTVEYLGVRKQADFEHPLDAVRQTIAPGAEPSLPKGGQRLWYFDLTLRLPVLVITRDHRGQEVDYNRFREFTFPAQLSDDDFDPEILWRR